MKSDTDLKAVEFTHDELVLLIMALRALVQIADHAAKKPRLLTHGGATPRMKKDADDRELRLAFRAPADRLSRRLAAIAGGATGRRE